MRRITKGPEPDVLRMWKEENAEAPQNLTYSNMPKPGVKSQMLEEQGYLCGYTMQRISAPEECQIEHVIPRSQNLALQIDYGNMLACYPSNRPGKRPERGKCPFGAERKDQTPIYDHNFVSPLREDVEGRMRYHADGTVTAVGDDGAATSTIDILCLDHQRLVELRRAAIEERVLDPQPALSPEEARELAGSIMLADGSGRVPEFCIAISHVAAWYAERVLRD